MVRLLGALLVAGGVLGLVYHHFTYTQAEHEAKLGPIELSVSQRHSVDVPEWAAVGAVVIGASMLLLAGGIKR